MSGVQNWLALYGSFVFLGLPMLMYVGQGCAVYFAAGRYGMTLAMCSYAMANVGLILDAYGY